MRTGYLTEIRKVEVKELDKLSVGNLDVLIRVKAAGICGSDVHAYSGTHPFRKPPMVLGHEVSGKVVEVGKGVTQFHPGDRVTVEPQKSCGNCTYCKEGSYHLCTSKVMAGVEGWTGSFAEYFLAPESRVYRLPEQVNYDLGVLAEPLAVGVHAVRISRMQLNENVVVLGTGPIGLCAAIAAQETGHKHVFCTDVNDFRLKKAREFGILTVNVERESVETKSKKYAPDGFDVAILTVTSVQVVNQALQLVRRGGRVIIVSVFTSDIPINLGLVQNREIRIEGSNTYTREDFMQSLSILSNRKELEQIITHHIGFDGINKAMEELTSSETQALKIIVQP